MRRIFLLGCLLAGCYQITVSPQGNHKPTADNLAFTTAEDTTLTIEIADLLATGKDDDEDVLSFGVTANLVGGTLTPNATQLVFDPTPNFSGEARFSYTLVDIDGGESDPATVTITVSPTGDLPSANAQAIITTEDTSKIVNLTANDGDLDDLTFNIVQQPSKGTLSTIVKQGALTANVTYTPNRDANGADNFTFHVNDGTTTSSDVTVSINITPVNDIPVANNDNNFVAQRGGASIDIPVLQNDIDPDNDPIQIQITTPPSQGTAIIVNDVTLGLIVRYTPNNTFVGAVSLVYTAQDNGQPPFDTATAFILVSARCGDAIVDSGEQCDDGNAISGDACETDCSFSCASNIDPDAVDVLGQSCYAALFSSNTNFEPIWQDAESLCSVQGGHLASITSAAESNFIRTTSNLLGAGDTPWIGGNDLAIEGTFTWSSGDSFSLFSNFNAGQPNNGGGNENCLYMLNNGKWDDVDCNNLGAAGAFLVNSLICEIPLP